MTAADLAEFRAWAEQHAPLGYVPAVRAADLLAERDRLRAEVVELHARLLAAAERIADQSELLQRKAEVPV